MMTMNKYSWIALLLGLSLLLAACGTVNIGVENTKTIVIVTESGPVVEPGAMESQAVTPEVVTPELTAEVTQEPAPVMENHQYWYQGEDPRTGVRFAIPCFWEYDIPQDDPDAQAAFSLRNYPYSYAESFPRGEGVFEAGGIKIDVLYFDYVDWGLPAGSGPQALAMSMYSAQNTETTLDRIEQVVYNNQPVLRVVTESTFGTGISYWYDLSPETVLVLGIAPTEADVSDDVQAILSSISLSPDVPVQMPLIPPANPPQGVQADCISEIAGSVDSDNISGTLDCATTDTASLDYTACNVIAGLRSGNTAALPSWMGDPFIMGYWASEYNPESPTEAIETMRQGRLPPDTSKLSFTNERAKFPPLEGTPPEDILGPEVNVVEILYSEGWGQDGMGSALLYFAQDEAGRYYWYGILISFGLFDR